jgi:uncharacterized protein YdgA (DUF945 family)
MRKLIIVLFVVFIVAIAGLPPVFGVVYEKQFEEQLDVGQLSPYTEFRVAEFERGLYSSHATVAFSLTDDYVEQLRAAITPDDSEFPATPEQLENLEALIGLIEGELRFDVDIKHGPASFPDGRFIGLATLTSTLDSSTGELAELQKELNLPYLFALNAQVGLDGSTDFQGDVPPFQQVEADTTIDFSGLNIDGHYNNAERRVTAASTIDTLGVDNPAFGLTIGGVALNTDQTILENYFSVGTTDVSIDEIIVSGSATGEEVQIGISKTGMNVAVAVDETGDNMSMNLNYEIGEVSGFPEMAISDIQLNLSLSEINLEAMYAYIDASQKIGMMNEDTAEEYMAEMQTVVFQLLNGSPRLSIDPVAFRLNDEPFNAQMQVDFDGTALPPGSTLQALVGNPGLWLSALSGTARIETSDTMANLIAGNILKSQLTATLGPESEISEADLETLAAGQSQMMIESFVQQGMIKRKERLLSSDLSYKGGELVVNEMIMPFGMF